MALRAGLTLGKVDREVRAATAAAAEHLAPAATQEHRVGRLLGSGRDEWQLRHRGQRIRSRVKRSGRGPRQCSRWKLVRYLGSHRHPTRPHQLTLRNTPLEQSGGVQLAEDVRTQVRSCRCSVRHPHLRTMTITAPSSNHSNPGCRPLRANTRLARSLNEELC